MGTRDGRFDAYIEHAADFAQPILNELRKIVHSACPDVEETMKWSSPTFMYQGILCGMAAFKQHCVFHFWKEALLRDNVGGDTLDRLNRLTDVSEIPSRRTVAKFIKAAMELNEQGIAVPRSRPRKALAVPDYLLTALKRNRKAIGTFEKLSPSHRREYIEWISEAKRAETRTRRIATAIEWLAAGKPRNWKHM